MRSASKARNNLKNFFQSSIMYKLKDWECTSYTFLQRFNLWNNNLAITLSITCFHNELTTE